ncbi:hypothetical protein [Sphingomonas glacialis]|uniref:Uncharacterized protein n=1 Tax=Sphingomonas glacialis TaxID=658225 RepID=A0A502FFI1_9SPHN|nr:hypothetical protein [Sphingomonas glacialis]TPG48086.1 hypothetical protein EAH76_21990 [Sphingomonas glacialis]
MLNRRVALIAGAIVAALAVYNGILTIPVALARQHESGITMVAYRRWLIDPTTAVVDLWRVDRNASMADVDRNLFEVAEALKAQSFTNVELAYKGTGRFLLDGTQFKTIGEERSFQNPVYTIRTLPQHITKLDGTPAFGTYEGGFLGVLSAQMSDHSQLHWSWYLASMSGADPSSTMPKSGGAGF